MSRPPLSVELQNMAEALEVLYLDALRIALRATIRAAINNTVQDSSNAAAHWKFISSTGAPVDPEFSSMKDFRGSVFGGVPQPGPKHPMILHKGANRSKTAAGFAAHLRSGEVSRNFVDKIDAAAVPGDIFLYNAVLDEGHSAYVENAKLDEAIDAAVNTFNVEFSRLMNDTQINRVRKFRRRTIK